MPLPLVPLIAAGASLIGSGISARQSRKNTKDTIQAQKEMAQYQWKNDLDMWNRQNVYNSPQAQMSRFKDAGLNPNLIYGQGNAGNASTLPKYSSVRPDYSQRQSVSGASLSTLGQFQDFQMKNAQIDNIREQNNLTKERALTEVVDRSLRKTQRLLAGRKAQGEISRSNIAFHDEQIKRELAQYSKEYAKQEIRKRQQDIRNKTSAADLRSLELEWYKWMKSSGIAGQSIAPLLRILIGR